MSPGSVHSRPDISPARFGRLRVYRHTSGCFRDELIEHMNFCARASFRLRRLRALAALPIRATSRKSMRVCAGSARAFGGDSWKPCEAVKERDPVLRGESLLLDC